MIDPTNYNTISTKMEEEVDINELDIKQILKTSKNKKALGPENIYIELLKYKRRTTRANKATKYVPTK